MDRVKQSPTLADRSAQALTCVVVGLGSPHGDDRAGWRVMELLNQRDKLPVRAVAVDGAIKLLDLLPHCERLIVVDACRTGNRVGAVTRIRWPDGRLAAWQGCSTHGFGLREALVLAQQLGNLPTNVEICGIEAADCSPGIEMSRETLQAAAMLEAQLYDELVEEASSMGDDCAHQT